MFDATKYFQGSKRGCLKHPAGNASEMSLILFTSSSSCNISFWYDLIDKFCSFFTRSKSAKRSVKLARLTSASAAVKRFSANEWRYFFFSHQMCFCNNKLHHSLTKLIQSVKINVSQAAQFVHDGLHFVQSLFHLRRRFFRIRFCLSNLIRSFH